jgi:GT2 family glycosyltransferase
MARAAVVILNHNGAHHLQQFLPSVLANSAGADIMVADNGSGDGSLELLRTRFPEVKIIAFPVNYGFCEGYNRALEQVEATLCVLLNSDVEVPAGWLGPVLELFDRDARLAAAQPKIRAYRQPETFEYAGAAGGWIDALGYPFCRGRLLGALERDDGQYDDTEQVFWASGACMFVRTDLFRSSGGFDPHFFAHMEEIDLCWRLQNSGYRIAATGHSAVYHLGGGTLAAGHPRKTYLNFRNGFMLLVKNLPAGEMLWKLPVRTVLDLLSALVFAAGGRFGHAAMVLRAQFFVWTRFFSILRRRRGPHLPSHRLKGVARRVLLFDYYARGIRRFSALGLSNTRADSAGF